MKNIFKLLNKREQKIFLENKNLANKLWKIIPESNKRPMDATRVIDIVKNENSSLNIDTICKKFNIVLKRNMKLKKYNSKSIFDGNNITIEYKDKKEVYEQLGHIFQNFLSSIYFQYPPKYNLKTIDLHEKKAKNFAKHLKILEYNFALDSKDFSETQISFKDFSETQISFKECFEMLNNLENKVKSTKNQQYFKINKTKYKNDELKINKTKYKNDELKINSNFSKVA
ncbi:hypothetical protein ACSKW8_000950 [Campylobacter lari]|uniref:hypothetical protein n=1 Tax=Campylobacter TaxID=194 RepID=UPI0017D2D747|nr:MULTISPECIES: hypothetical protein [Campylobacter]EAI3897243.1 hypothetical protein [Campylobacter lari]EHC7929206.1 hypothetical protein [Campylobacter lari]MCR2079415.1 hypothetical protein [Campylobacter lari subsp. concheus]MCV3424511.1 hypothetical protein [Campylobacter sp. IFREMER_LSEM_CL1085]MCV3442873.1 hypothetical protein [Campylobacter sp. IFREMER_LSEM_CL1097]